MTFSLKALKPANSFETLTKVAPGKTAKMSAVENIDAQIALLDPKVEGKRTIWDTVLSGKRSFTGKGASVGFYVKAGASKLTISGTQEFAAPATEIKSILEGLKAAIEKGELDKELAALDSAKSARTDKMRATRQEKKGK